MQNKPTKSTHSKHAKLTKPSIGEFNRNEWSFLGAPCGVIKDLVTKIAEKANAPVLYIDESHDHEAAVSNLSVATKKGAMQSVDLGLSWGKNQNACTFDSHDFVLVNGNHFKAEKQFVILDPRKEESLSRKLDRLTDLKALITTDARAKPYNFLRNEEGLDIVIPTFHISEVDAIWDFIKKDYQMPPLKGLVLAGGKSERMGHDKGAIDYHGSGQAQHMYHMLEEVGIETYISCRKEQASKYTGMNQIHDKFIGLGPFGAIASAFMEDPNSAWVIVPCDLPLLDRSHLETLTSHRNAHKYGTAFLNKYTSFPEPLISIWEPKMYQRMLGFLAQGLSCPRKVLINSDVELITAEDQQFMMNVNTPEDLARASILIEKQ